MADNSAQKNSPSFRLAALDPDFLLGDSMRGVRLQIEYEKAEERLRAWTVRSTIVVFGSARMRPGGAGARWYEEARLFGKIASERGGALNSHHGVRDNVIATGGGPGIMEAANRGAADAGAPSIGYNIGLPHEQEPNAYSTPDLTFQFHYFAIRKLHFAMRANALVVFPGGFGTFDELFEILTLIQTGKMPAVPVLLIDASYWRSAMNFEKLAEEGTIDRCRSRSLLLCRRRRKRLAGTRQARTANWAAAARLSVEAVLLTAIFRRKRQSKMAMATASAAGGDIEMTFLQQIGDDPFSATPDRATQIAAVAKLAADFVAGARESLDIAIYDFRLDDDAAAIVSAALRERARSNVAIRIIYDATTEPQATAPGSLRRRISKSILRRRAPRHS